MIPSAHNELGSATGLQQERVRRHQARASAYVCYDHEQDQWYANELRDFYGSANTLIDRSLPEDFDSDDDDYVLEQIRKKHLKTSTVTIVLVGARTCSLKWVDWEIYASLRPYGRREANGLLAIILPTATEWPARLQDNYQERFEPSRPE